MEEDIDGAAIIFYIFVAFSVLFLVFGIALFYTGLTSPKTALTQCSYSIIGYLSTILQLAVVGYSLVASSRSGPFGWFVGDFNLFMLGNLPTDPNELIKELGSVFIYAGFAAVCSAIMLGAATQRGRLIPSLVFLMLWLTVVYCPVAYWTWNDNGWARKLGVLDYAGGTVVHCVAGFTALTYSLALGPRIDYESNASPPYNLLLVVIGTFFMMSGWVGFNGGSAMTPEPRVLIAIANTAFSAAMGGFIWMFLDHSLDGEWSLVGFCSGVVSGMVAITPGAAYVDFSCGLLFGLAGGLVCNLSTKLKFLLDVDDTLDIFAVHGIGGIVGTLMTGLFANPKYSDHAGLFFGHPIQLFRQIALSAAIIFYTAGMSMMLLMFVDMLPGLELRVSPDMEQLGLDLGEHGEMAGTHYVESAPGSQLSGSQHDSNYVRYKQTHLNTSMFPSSESPLLERAARGYGSAPSSRI